MKTWLQHYQVCAESPQTKPGHEPLESHERTVPSPPRLSDQLQLVNCDFINVLLTFCGFHEKRLLSLSGYEDDEGIKRVWI